MKVVGFTKVILLVGMFYGFGASADSCVSENIDLYSKPRSQCQLEAVAKYLDGKLDGAEGERIMNIWFQDGERISVRYEVPDSDAVCTLKLGTYGPTHKLVVRTISEKCKRN